MKLKTTLTRRFQIETRHLKIFAAVYKNKSFTKAADQLNTSQPTISEHVRNLEERLNCKLFDRLGRTIIPTTEAELLYPRALAILDDLRKLADDLTAVGTRVSGKIVIAASTIPSAFVLPGMAADFNTTYPDISFEIRTSSSAQVIDAVLNNEILLGVVGATSSNSKLNFRAFKKDTLVLAASTKMIVDQPVTTTTLLELPFIMREQGSGTRKSMERFLAEKDIKLSQLNTRAVFGSSTAVCEAVKANLGVSILSSHAIKDSVKNGQIQVIEIYNLPMIRNFYTVTTKKRSLPRHYQAFLQQLLAHEDSLHDSV